MAEKEKCLLYLSFMKNRHSGTWTKMLKNDLKMISFGRFSRNVSCGRNKQMFNTDLNITIMAPSPGIAGPQIVFSYHNPASAITTAMSPPVLENKWKILQAQSWQRVRWPLLFKSIRLRAWKAFLSSFATSSAVCGPAVSSL